MCCITAGLLQIRASGSRSSGATGRSSRRAVDSSSLGRSIAAHYDSARGVAGDDQAMYALNFYSPMVADQLRSHRKTATIRLGDKSRKYRKGMIVQVLAGTRYSPRLKIFDAVIDKVEVKQLGELSPREIEH